MKKLLILLALGAIIVPVMVFSQSRVPASVSSEPQVPASISSKSFVPPAFPCEINYQGMVTDNGGLPIPGPDVDMHFKIYDHPTVGMGSMLWDEEQLDVPVSEGLFNTTLGSVDPIDLSFYEADEFWLDITVDGEQMPDRLNFVSVAFAFRSLKADSAEADPDWTISGNDMYSAVSGDVGIGMSSPDEKLDVDGTVQMTGFKMPTGATFGYVLTSDGVGGGTWAPGPSGGIGGSGTANYIPYFTSSTTIDNSVIYQDGSNVGIGATSPTSRLEVNGDIEVRDDDWIGIGSSAERITFDSDGNDIEMWGANVGIGTGSPAEALHVVGDIRLNAGGDIAFTDDNTRVYESSDDLYITADDDIFLRPDDDVYIRADGGSDWVRFDNGNKRLGIGTTSPSHNLDVAGQVEINSAANVKALYVYSNSFASAEMVNFYTTQNVTTTWDMLEIHIGSGSSNTMQFIECERGGDTEFRVNGNGAVYSDVGYYVPAADFSEMIAVSSGASTVEPGDVMVIDPNNPRSISRSSQPRSTLVAGVYSTKPGFIGSEREWDKPAADGGEEPTTLELEDMASEFNEIPLAVVGITPCKVSAENGAIRPGDLLVTSSTPGHAMRDDNPKVGTVVGKALGSLGAGTGVIKVLVTLH